MSAPKPKTYCFDIDGTLCTNTEGKYELAVPYPDRIRRVNALYDEGNVVLLLTARGSTTGIDWGVLTRKQLADWGVKYHALHFGKPSADFYVDDKGLTIEEWLSKTRASV